MFNGKIHYKWSFSIAMLVYQRVSYFQFTACIWEVSCINHRSAGDVGWKGVFFWLRVLQWQCNGKLLWNLWHRMARLFFLLFTWCNIRKGVLSARTTLCFPKRSQELLAWDTLNSKDIPYTLATLTGKIWKTIFQKGIEHAGCLQSGSWILYSKH